jgi:hypothetical protein
LSKGQGESVPVTPSQRSRGSGMGGEAQFSTASATPLGEENKGFKMLQAMGWRGGSDSGLGAQEQVNGDERASHHPAVTRHAKELLVNLVTLSLNSHPFLPRL